MKILKRNNRIDTPFHPYKNKWVSMHDSHIMIFEKKFIFCLFYNLMIELEKYAKYKHKII